MNYQSPLRIFPGEFIDNQPCNSYCRNCLHYFSQLKLLFRLFRTGIPSRYPLRFFLLAFFAVSGCRLMLILTIVLKDMDIV